MDLVVILLKFENKTAMKYRRRTNLELGGEFMVTPFSNNVMMGEKMSDKR